MRSAFSKAIFVGLAIATTAVVNCSSESNKGGSTAEANTGTVGLKLTLAPGAVINTVSYTITGPTAKSGTIDVTNSQSVSAVIGGLAAGGGYHIALTALTTDGVLTCAGGADFTVVARTTSVVNVALTCKRAGSTGSILVNGVLNVCPIIDSVSSTAPVNGVIQLSSTANDIDGVPAALSYNWSIVAGGSGAGTLSSATAQNPTITCTGAGSVNLSLVVSDGDNTNCVPADRTFTTTVTCPSASSVPDAGGAGGSGGGGAGGSGGGGSAGTGGGTIEAGTDAAGSAGTGGGTVEAGTDAAGSGGTGGGTVDAGPDVVAEAEAAAPACGNATCAACEAVQCPGYTTACNAFTGADKTNCLALIDCMRATSCHAVTPLDCYCGTADTTQCLATTGVTANGSCKAQFETAFGTTTPSTIQANFSDITLPGGAASQIALCDQGGCPAECIPFGPNHTCP